MLVGVGENQAKGSQRGVGQVPSVSPDPALLSLSLAEFQVPVTEPDINNRLESLCLSMTEHALSGEHSLLLGLFQHVQAASAKPPRGCPTPPKGWDQLWL